MNERPPKSINLAESGMDQNGDFIIRQSDIPSALRDVRGRVIWRLRGNTSEEDEQLGIHNIQALFLEKFPEFEIMFPRVDDGKIAENKRDKAREFILMQLENKKKFTTIFGHSPRLRKNTPYFEGSIRVAITKSFSPWGLNFNFPEKLSAENEELTTLWECAAKHDLSFGTVASMTKNLPCVSKLSDRGRCLQYYSTTQLEEVLKSVTSLQRQKDSATYIDKEGKRRISAKKLASEYEIGYRQTKQILDELSYEVRGRVTKLYDETEARERIEQKIGVRKDLSFVDRQTGGYTDETGRTFKSVTALHRELGIDIGTIKTRLEGVPSRKAMIWNKRQIDVYDEDEVRKRINALLALPQIDKENGEYIDTDTKRAFVTTGFFNIHYGVKRKTMLRLAKQTGSIKGKDAIGHETKLYPKLEIIALLEAAKDITPKEANKWLSKTLEKKPQLPAQQKAELKDRYQLLENLSDQQRYEINRKFWEFIKENPDSNISIVDFAIDYLRRITI